MQQTTANWIALIILIAATAIGFYFIWGLLFIYWSVRSYYDGTVFLLSPIHRSDTPVLYWALSALWLLFGLWYLISDGFWRIGIYQIFGYNLYP